MDTPDNNLTKSSIVSEEEVRDDTVFSVSEYTHNRCEQYIKKKKGTPKMLLFLVLFQ